MSILLVGALLAAIPTQAAATTILVSADDPATDADGCGGGAGPGADPCNTIQAGVDTAAGGDTVRVEQGHYSGAVIVDKPGISIVGPFAGVPGFDSARVKNFDDGEAIINGPYDAPALKVIAANVRLDGLRITSSYPGITLESTGADVRNDLLDFNECAIRVIGGGNTVSANSFYGNMGLPAALYSNSALSGLHVIDNMFGGQQFVPAIDLAGPAQKSDVVIDSNTVLMNRGIVLRNLARSRIANNTVTDLLGTYGYVGVQLDGATDVTVAGNKIMYAPVGMQLGTPGTSPSIPIENVTISGNDFSKDGQPGPIPSGGIYVTDGAALIKVSIVANRFFDNSPSSNSRGIVADPSIATTLHAENNWWGCNAGPGAPGCDTVSDVVDANPWLVFSLSAAPARVAIPGSAVFQADVLTNSDHVSVPEASSVPSDEVDFTRESGPGLPTESFGLISGGVATTTLSSSIAGTALVRADVDFASARATVDFVDTLAKGSRRDVVAPTLERASLTHDRFAVDPRGRPEQPVAARIDFGTTVRYALSEQARVTFRIDRVVKRRGRADRRNRHPGSCRPRRRCPGYRTVGRFAVQSIAGANREHFSGKIGHRSLSPGRYRLVLVATDSTGNRSKSRMVGFRVIRR